MCVRTISTMLVIPTAQTVQATVPIDDLLCAGRIHVEHRVCFSSIILAAGQ